MATVKDSIGNELATGDKVLYKMPNGDTLVGTICEIVPGSSVIPGGQMKMLHRGGQVQEVVTPGEVRIIARLTTEIDPRNPIANNCVKVHDPEKAALRTKLGGIVEVPN